MIPQKLRIMILKSLVTTPQSGYGLIKSIDEATGWKPSYGSMYPQLEQLKEEGLVTVKEKGRKKIYTLTKAGTNASKEFSKDNTVIIEKMRENMKTMAHMIGADMDVHNELTEIFFSAIKSGDAPLSDLMHTSTRLKMALLKLHKEGKLKKNKKAVKAIIIDAANKMEKLL